VLRISGLHCLAAIDQIWFELFQVFEPFGPVELVQLPADIETGQSKGFGFVQVSCVAYSLLLICILCNYLLGLQMFITKNTSQVVSRLFKHGGLKCGCSVMQAESKIYIGFYRLSLEVLLLLL
jgi:hypothetical protein